MSRRPKNSASPAVESPAPVPAPEPNGNGQAAPAVEPVPAAEDTIPTFEERLAVLEAKLLEQQSLIQRQAAVIVQAAENADTLARSREKVERLKDEHEDAKSEASAAKKRYEAAVDEHFALERDLGSGQQRLPFPPDPEPAKPAEELPAPNAMAAADDAPDETWRTVKLSNLGVADELPDGIVFSLADAGLETLGQLHDWLQPGLSGYTKRLTDIAGIGAAKAEKIECALEAFWARRALDAEASVNQELLDGVREVEAAREGDLGFEVDEDPSDSDANDFNGEMDFIESRMGLDGAETPPGLEGD
jgi:uncharacterized coiled-coil protein SlyX